jgi:deazaflavin-dependent oxidoreductase (nitroreductase family)
MSEAAGSTPDNPIDSKAGWVKAQLDEYLATDGAKPVFRHNSPLLLLTYKGRKSGNWHRTVLIYAPDDDRYLIVASKGGAEDHPTWYLSLEENPEVQLQVGPRVFTAIARTATADEKPPLWDKAVSIYPDYADYQVKTTRPIPVVILEPVATAA